MNQCYSRGWWDGDTLVVERDATHHIQPPAWMKK
jgi:hypothetical protein